jgi:hypothetical protein
MAGRGRRPHAARRRRCQFSHAPRRDLGAPWRDDPARAHAQHHRPGDQCRRARRCARRRAGMAGDDAAVSGTDVLRVGPRAAAGSASIRRGLRVDRVVRVFRTGGLGASRAPGPRGRGPERAIDVGRGAGAGPGGISLHLPSRQGGLRQPVGEDPRSRARPRRLALARVPRGRVAARPSRGGRGHDTGRARDALGLRHRLAVRCPYLHGRNLPGVVWDVRP